MIILFINTIIYNNNNDKQVKNLKYYNCACKDNFFCINSKKIMLDNKLICIILMGMVRLEIKYLIALIILTGKVKTDFLILKMTCSLIK